MRLLNLSWPMWMVGLIGLASLLFLLQRLRVRYRQPTQSLRREERNE